ncbi:hypothetical protein [Burkholderia sp. AU6039]|uniref:hypothetical protein n=1 Tax=Burkholderia sp. AU6039 TaxID=2015344 RepID=UPI00118027C4|nr:hypothetical protein [Burkholderia sp. AU6039]
MNHRDDKIENLVNKYPGDFSFSGRCFEVIYLAASEFLKFSKGEWPLGNYEIEIGFNDGETLMSVSFIPVLVHEVEGVPFEISNQGMYGNGCGVKYISDVIEQNLIKSVYMH